MHSLRRRLSQRWQTRDSESPVFNDPCQGETGDEAANVHVSPGTALLPKTESRTVEDYSSEELHFIVDYVGSAPISEAQSLTRMMETLKRVKKLQIRSSMRVNFTIRDGILIVSCVGSNSLILTAPLYAIALCGQEQLRGFDSTFGLNITRKKTHMCHVFEAGSQLEAASIVRTVALSFKVIGKMTREKHERANRRTRRTHSVSSSERTRTNSEVSTTSTVGSSSERRHQHVQWRHNLEGTSGRKSPHSKKFNKNSASPSILRHPSSSHTSGRHVEFSALSPVPSDGSDCDGRETAVEKKEPTFGLEGVLSVQADVHSVPPSDMPAPIWVKRDGTESVRRSRSPLVTSSILLTANRSPGMDEISHSVDEDPIHIHKQETPSLVYVVPEPSEAKENHLKSTPAECIPTNLHVKRALNESLEKVAAQKDLGPIKLENETASENFTVSGSFLPIEHFHKQVVFPPDHTQQGFDSIDNYQGQPPDLLPGSDGEDPRETEIVHLAIKAVERGEMAQVEKYLDNGLSVDAHDCARRSLLYHAVSLGYVELSQLFLKRGADINWEGPGDKSPLHVAASVGNRAVTQLLLAHGANVRAKDSNFCTPLHMSAGHRSNLEVSFLLVENGARIYENNIHGVRPVDIEPELKEMQRLLVQSACEGFAAADLTKSRSNSGASSLNQSTASASVKSKSLTCTPHVERLTMLRKGLFQNRRSSSLCSISGGHGSPETGRGKAPIRRTESIHLSQTLSPMLANSRKGGLQWLHNQQRATQNSLPPDSKPNPNVPDNHSYTDEQQVGTKRVVENLSLSTITVQEDANPRVTGDLVSTCDKSKHQLVKAEVLSMEDESEKNASLNVSEILEEWQLNNTKTPPRKNVTEGYFSSPDVPQTSFLPFDVSTSPDSSIPSAGSNPVSPFIPKSSVPERFSTSVSDATAVSDLIRFGDKPPVVGRVETTHQACDVPEDISLSEEVKQPVRKHRRPSNVRQPSFESEQSVSGQRSVSECEESSLLSTGSHCAKDEENVINAMEPVVLLSGNPECHSSLLAYLCLPKASGQLITLAHLDSTSSFINNNIAVLIGNLFNLEGADSRKRAVEAGLLETVLKLVDSSEPIQSTCLSILHNILEFNKEQEYSSALKTIPLEPVLNLLQTSDVDSGAFDLRHTDSPPPGSHDKPRQRKRSTCSQSSFDDRPREMSPIALSRVSVQRNNSGASDVRSESWPHHGGYTMQKKNSICSMGSSVDGDHSFPLYSPGFGHSHLPLMDLHTKTMPRLVATKMLSASSVHPKMQVELGNTRPLSLLLETLTDSNPDIVIYSAATLANIALTLENHMQMELSGVADGLKQMLSCPDARVRYHAARGLIYLGHMNVGGVYLFKRVPGDEKVDVLFADSTGEEQLFARGATIEKIVEIITNNPSLLWGGLKLPLPSSRGKKHSLHKTNSPGSRVTATEEQIIDFLLTTYKSFVHSTILLRLLLHRFHDPWFGKYFDGNPSTGQMEQFSPLPLLHIYLMRIWTAWLGKYPEDFINNPAMATELNDVLIPMRQAGGPYLSCAKNLEDLIHSLMERAARKGYSDRFQANHCHHAILYEQCQKAIVNGNLPCSADDAVYLASLQLYIEDLTPAELSGKPWFFPSSSRERLTASRIKLSLNPSLYKMKNIAKRVKAQYEQFVMQAMTERNAKHNYIDCCQAMAGYGCQFFKLKEFAGIINPKGTMFRRYLGISPKKITLLDDRTKAVIGTWQVKDLKRWRSAAGDTRLRLEFSNISFEFLLENKGGYKEINDVLLLCTKVDFQIIAGQDFTPWSKYAEETEMWGPKAIAAVAVRPTLYSEKYESDSGVVSRLRAISLASSVPDQYPGKVKRQMSLSAKLSSSAPYQQGALQKDGRGKMVSPPETEPMLTTTAGTGTSAVSSGSPGNLSAGTHTSEELLLGSLLSTPGASKCSWEPGSLQTTDGKRRSRESETSVDEAGSPTEKEPLDPSGTVTFPQDIKPQKSSTGRRRKYTTESITSSLASDSPDSSGQTTPNLPHRGPFSTLFRDEELPNVNRVFGLSPQGQLLICHCPPDAELPGFDRRNFTAYDLLQFPKELARQITLIDHECFCAVTSTDIQKKLVIGTGKRKKSPSEEKLAVEKVADRFNQRPLPIFIGVRNPCEVKLMFAISLSTWVVAGILTEESVEKRANMFIKFIETAKLCLELRNFNAVMAIVVAALGSAPVRRLHKTKELVPKECLEQYAKMEILMDTKDNYKRYRQALAASPTPLVPYFGIYMKDLTFVTEGNPDFFKGGLINLTKRRQIYVIIDEIRRCQGDLYNFQEVPEVRDYLASQEIHTGNELHNISRQLEPGHPRRHSEADKTGSIVPGSQFKSNTVGRLAGKRYTSFSRSSTTLEAAVPDSNC